MSYQAECRQRVAAAMERRGLTDAEVARMSGVVPRTVNRFVRGKTFSPKTYDLLAAALRLEGASASVEVDSRAPRRANVRHALHVGPVSSWKQAAVLLGVSRRTLERRRQQHRDRTQVAWWKSIEALWRWYDRMIRTGVR